MAGAAVGASSLTERRYDIDWLRIAAVLLLIPFHSARVFDTWETWYIKNRTLSRALSAFVSVVSPWHMSLLFLLAGCGTWLAMRHRSGRQYAGERPKRLGVPLLFGVLVIVPPQTWIGVITHGHGYESFAASYKRYWTSGSDGLTGYAGGWTPGHLWFILFLLMLALLALPLFRSLRGGRGRRVVEAFARAAHRPLVLMLPAVGLMLAWALTIQFDFLELSGQNPLGYLFLLVFGFLLVADERITAAIARHWVWMLPAGLGAVGIMVAFRMGGLPHAGGGWGRVQVWLVEDVLRCAGVWLTMVGFIGMAQRVWNKRGRLWGYACEAAYPFYILHQTVIVFVGYAVVRLGWGVPAKYALIAVGSLSATLITYDAVVRRVEPLRFLFGMKRRRAATPAAAPVRQPAAE